MMRLEDVKIIIISQGKLVISKEKAKNYSGGGCRL
jgi:hypothetical protein